MVQNNLTLQDRCGASQQRAQICRENGYSTCMCPKQQQGAHEIKTLFAMLFSLEQFQLLFFHVHGGTVFQRTKISLWSLFWFKHRMRIPLPTSGCCPFCSPGSTRITGLGGLWRRQTGLFHPLGSQMCCTTSAEEKSREPLCCFRAMVPQHALKIQRSSSLLHKCWPTFRKP